MQLYTHWQKLHLATRNKIASDFGIIKKGPTEVFANTIKSDGYLFQDIEAKITVKSIQEFLHTTETDETVLWNYLVDKEEGRDIQILDLKPKEDVKQTKTKGKKNTKN